MNLTTVRTGIERLAKTPNALSESGTLVPEMSKEVRTISHLLHPSLLDEAGLSSALRWYKEGFAERSKIQVDMKRVGMEAVGRVARANHSVYPYLQGTMLGPSTESFDSLPI